EGGFGSWALGGAQGISSESHDTFTLTTTHISSWETHSSEEHSWTGTAGSPGGNGGTGGDGGTGETVVSDNALQGLAGNDFLIVRAEARSLGAGSGGAGGAG